LRQITRALLLNVLIQELAVQIDRFSPANNANPFDIYSIAEKHFSI